MPRPNSELITTEKIRLVGAIFNGAAVDAAFWTAAVSTGTVTQASSELVLTTADPLVTGTGTGEWQQIGTSDGTWYEYTTSWMNHETYPVTIYARFLATAATGNAWSDCMWAFDVRPWRGWV